MRFLRSPVALAACLWAWAAGAPGYAQVAGNLPAPLQALALRSSDPSTWPGLRHYAERQSDAELKGWAYFLAGYQEDQAKSYIQAAEDLNEAAGCVFSLADFAALYEAAALGLANRPQEAAQALQDFNIHFPQSPLRMRALTMRANALLAAQQPQQAVDALLAEPAVHQQPFLAILLGQAYVAAQRPAEAALTYQQIYYNFPASPQAKSAAEALKPLRSQLGAEYPVPSEETMTARAAALSIAGRYDDAISQYDDLLAANPSSPRTTEWQLGRATCLVRMHKTADALRALSLHLEPSDWDAQRLALMVQVHAQQSDTLGITQDLAQLESAYSTSHAYADALSSAGIFYYRQLDWPEAARDYQRLLELFPSSGHLREDGWRLAWCDYLQKDPKTASVITEYLKSFPDSTRAPAALFWLGRVEEEQGIVAEARGLYGLLVHRFPHCYYASQAAARMAALASKTPAAGAGSDSMDSPLAGSLIPVLAPATVPEGLACLNTTPADVVRPALILLSINLKNLEEEYVRASLGEDNPPPELRLLLARIYAAADNPAAALFVTMRAAPGYTSREFSDLPAEAWHFLYPQPYTQLIEQQARLNHLDPYLVMGLIRQESAYSPRALSSADARGLMQVLPRTGAETIHSRGTRLVGRRLYEPAFNIRVGCTYLAMLLKEFDGEPQLALAAYNAGDFRVRDWKSKYAFPDADIFLESIPIPATRNYVELVLRDADVYRQLLKGTQQFAVCHPAEGATPPRAVNAKAAGATPASTRPAHLPVH